jgi:hypothetical protein
MTLSPPSKALFIAAAVIVLLFIIGDHHGLRSTGREPRAFVIELDTAEVVAIRFEDRREPGNNRNLFRTPHGWRGDAGDDHATGEAVELLTRFQRIPVKRDMGMLLLLAERYDLTEHTLRLIRFVDIRGVEHALNLGSSTFAPGKAGSWTYVNVPGEKEIYAVEGLLAGTLR